MFANIKKHGLTWLIVVSLLLTWAVQPASAQVTTIDDFNSGSQNMMVTFNGDTATNTGNDGSNERDVYLVSQEDGMTTVSIDMPNTNVATYAAADNVHGYMEIRYDGQDSDYVWDPNPPPGHVVSYEEDTYNYNASLFGDAFRVTINSTDHGNWDMGITVYTDATHWSYYTWIDEAQVSSVTNYDVRFSSFSRGGSAGPANFANIGAIELTIGGALYGGVDENGLDMTIDWFGTYDDPTAVDLTSFTAGWNQDDVLVEWETGAEINTVGFNLWRSEAADGPYTQINDALIPGTGGGMGASYAYVDSAVTPGTTYYYKLQETEIGGKYNWYGPASTDDAHSPTAVGVSTFGADKQPVVWLPLATLLVGVGAWAWARQRRWL